MNGQEKRDSKRVPVALRIKLRFRKVDTFVSKFATNISTHGMFISSRKPKEPGTQLRFELRLADDSTVIAGRGKVTWVRPYDAKHPKEPHGMGIEFIGLSSASKDLIKRIVSLRVEQGLGDEGIPFAVQDADAGAIPAAASPSLAPSPGAVEMSLSDVESSKIDMSAALARARDLLGSEEPESQLAKLSRVSAAPVAETVDVASHELAKLLGGVAIVARTAPVHDPLTDVGGLEDILEPEPEPEQDELDATPAATAAFDRAITSDDSASDDDELDLPMVEDEPHELETPVPVGDSPVADDDAATVVPGSLSVLEMLKETTEGNNEDDEAATVVPGSISVLEMLEQTTVGKHESAGASEQVSDDVDDATDVALSPVGTRAPSGRAETESQDIGSYDQLAAEQEFATPPDTATRMQDNPLDDLLGQLESEVSQDALEAVDELDELDVLEEIEDSTAMPPAAGAGALDATLASLSDRPGTQGDEDDDFEIDVSEGF